MNTKLDNCKGYNLPRGRAIVGSFIAVLLCVTTGQAVMKPAVQRALPADGLHLPALLGKVEQRAEAWTVEAPNGQRAVWQAFRHSRSGSVAMAVGKPIPLINSTPSDDAIIRAGVDFAGRYAPEFGLEGCGFRVESLRRNGDRWVLFLQALLQDYPIYGAYAVLGVNASGELTSIKGQGFGADFEGSFRIATGQAVDAAVKLISGSEPISSARWWIPRKVGDAGNAPEMRFVLRPAVEVQLNTAEAEFRPTLFIDAESGALLAAENLVYYDRLDGEVSGFYYPLYETQDQIQSPFPDEWVQIGVGFGYSNANGAFQFDLNPGQLPYTLTTELRGRWVNVNYEDGPDAHVARRLDNLNPVTVVWNDNNSLVDERNLFWHVNVIHSYWLALDRDFQHENYFNGMPAICQYGDNYDNAFWRGGAIYFGAGSQMSNFALHADIIYHEYNHAVTSPNIYPGHILPYEGESGALNEAWSDYFACSLTDEPLMGEGGGMGGSIRNLDNDLVYPDDWYGEVHYDSRMISAAMWHSREFLRHSLADSLFHFARYELGNDFVEYFTDVLLTDDDNGDITDGTPHDAVLYAQFGRHGIGPGLFPKIVIEELKLFDDDIRGADGDDDVLYEPGETVRIEVTLFRDGTLFPPPAPDVRIQLSTENQHIEFVRMETGFGEMRVNDRVRADEPLLFRITEDAPAEFADLFVLVTDAEARSLARDTIHIPLGTPEVLLVQDGMPYREDRTIWLTQALEKQGVTYLTAQTYEAIIPVAQRLDQVSTVIWFSGDNRDGLLGGGSLNLLGEFLDEGGNLLMTGQSFDRASQQAADFIALRLGAVTTIDSLYGVFATGIDGDPVSEGDSLLMLGFRGAQNQSRPSGVEPVGDGVPIYHWERVEGRPYAGVRREDPQTGSRTIYLGFGLEAVSGMWNTNPLPEVMDRLLGWLGRRVEFDAPEADINQPGLFRLDAAYPNPFNGYVVLPFNLTQGGRYTLTVFDLAGRRIFTDARDLAAGESIWTVAAQDWGTGSYIFRLHGNPGTVYSRVTLLK